MEVIVKKNEIHKALWKWLFDGSNGISELSFISAQYDENGAIISDSRVIYTPITVGNTTEISQDIRGYKTKQYDFMLKQYAPLSSQSNTPANIIVLSVFENLIQWMQEQLNDGNLPLFPDNIQVNEFIINNGTIAGQDNKGAEFQIVINIIYEELEEEI